MPSSAVKEGSFRLPQHVRPAKRRRSDDNDVDGGIGEQGAGDSHWGQRQMEELAGAVHWCQKQLLWELLRAQLDALQVHT